MSTTKIIILSIVAGAVVGAAVSAVIFAGIRNPTDEERIADFYKTEVAVSASPHSIRKALAKGDDSFILVDLRSAEEYEKEHIIGAINIPAYSDPETSAYGDVERIVNAFRALPADKDIITYCYSMPCMTSRKIGAMLADNGIYVKHLNIGWNEWRYFWTLWNHELEWKMTKTEDFVTSGKLPGKFKADDKGTACPIKGEFGC